MNSASERLRILTNFLGFGHPDAPIWFVGLEEGGQWHDDPQEDERKYAEYGRGFLYTDAENRGRTAVYDIMSKIVVAALGDASARSYEEYRKHRLFREGGHAFQANLYPLGKKSLDAWPEWYPELFGVRTLDEYRERVRPDRYRLLQSARRKYARSVVICFGKTAWAEFREALDLDDAYDDSIVKRCRVYPSAGVVMTPFFSYRRGAMDRQTIAAVAECVRTFMVRRRTVA